MTAPKILFGVYLPDWPNAGVLIQPMGLPRLMEADEAEEFAKFMSALLGEMPRGMYFGYEYVA